MQEQATASPIVRFGFALAATFCVFGSPVMGFFLTRIFLEAKASARWPTAAGMLQKVEVRETAVNRYYADVEYTFSVAGCEYTGRRISASDGEYNIRDGAVQAIQGLRVGEAVAIYYNPSDPHQCVINAGAGFVEYFLLCLPVAIFAFGCTLFACYTGQKRKANHYQNNEPELPYTLN